MAFGYTATLPTITGSHSGFVVTLVNGSFPTASIDGGVSSINNGGGNLRAYTDSSKSSQLPVEISSFVTGGSPQILVFVRLTSASTGATIYIEADSLAVSQPAFGAAFGRNAVWSDYASVLHLTENVTNGVYIDSTGNGNDTSLTVGASLPNTATGHPFGLVWPDFDTSQYLTLAASGSIVDNTNFTLSVWCSVDISDNTRGLFGNWSGSLVDMTQMQSSTRRFSWNVGGSTMQFSGAARALATNTLVLLESDGSGLRAYDNNSLLGSVAGVGNLLTTTVPFQIGAYSANSASTRLDGRAGEARIKTSIDSDDYKTTEYDNQSNVSTWLTVGVWADSGSGISVTAESGTYSQVGTTTPITSQLNITTTAGSYLLTGSDVNLTSAKKLITETGSYDLTGTDVTLIYTPGGGGEVLIVDSGVYSLAGDEVLLRADLNIIANSNNYSITGTNTPIKYNASISVDSGSYSLVGTDLNLFANYGMIAVSSSYSLTGTSVTLKYSGDTNQVIGTVTAGFAPDLYSAGYKPNTITVTFKG